MAFENGERVRYDGPLGAGPAVVASPVAVAGGTAYDIDFAGMRIRTDEGTLSADEAASSTELPPPDADVATGAPVPDAGPPVDQQMVG